jgi:hypothetical protein
VLVQWDPERSIHGKSLPSRSIQVGLSRQIIARYVNEWTLEMKDMPPLVKKLAALLQSGHADKAKDLLPKERTYPLPDDIARRLGMNERKVNNED